VLREPAGHPGAVEIDHARATRHVTGRHRQTWRLNRGDEPAGPSRVAAAGGSRSGREVCKIRRRLYFLVIKDIA
jgi:hypothetical protein